MSIGSCWIFGWIVCIVIAATMSQDLESIVASPFGQPMAQIYYDALGKNGALGMMSLLMIVQYLVSSSSCLCDGSQADISQRWASLSSWQPLANPGHSLGTAPCRSVPSSVPFRRLLDTFHSAPQSAAPFSLQYLASCV